MNSKGTVVTLNDKVLTKYKQLSGSCSKTVKISMVGNKDRKSNLLKDAEQGVVVYYKGLMMDN